MPINLPLPPKIKHWSEVNGFLPSKKYGFNRKWRTHGFYAHSRRPEYTVGCVEPIRRIRVFRVRVSGYQSGSSHHKMGALLMQICDGNFDRWANSVGAEALLPNDCSESDFTSALKLMVSLSVCDGGSRGNRT